MEDLKSKSVYIHIPFCKEICSYCDFCKFYYNNSLVDQYLKSLSEEIKRNYHNELIETLYIGGGTPSTLSFDQLNKLFSIIDVFNLSKEAEFTFECNIEDINQELLSLLNKRGVTRLSIGIQTFNSELLKVLNRKYDKNSIDKIKLAKKYFDVNVDLIYAIPGETIKDLNNDLDILLKLDADHISTYSLIIEEHTKLYIDQITGVAEELDLEMYRLICHKLKANGYNHYEISNFAKTGKQSKHNLTYWNNDYYYGFGLSSSGYINLERYDNTKNINKYLKGEYLKESHRLSLNEQIENEFILGFRKIEGISKQRFYKKYQINLNDMMIINKLLKENKLEENKDYIYIAPHFIYTSNNILLEFLDIDYENMI